MEKILSYFPFGMLSILVSAPLVLRSTFMNGAFPLSGLCYVFLCAIIFVISALLAKKIAFAKNVLPVKRRPMGSLIVLLVVFSSTLAIHVIQDGNALAKIQRHGQRAIATVLNIHKECAKYSCALYAKYQFVPYGSPSASPVTGDAFLTNDHHVGYPNFLSARATGQIPIAYEIDNPSNSTVNFSDKAFTDDPMKTAFHVIGLVTLVFGTFIAVMLLATRFIVRRAVA